GNRQQRGIRKGCSRLKETAPVPLSGFRIKCTSWTIGHRTDWQWRRCRLAALRSFAIAAGEFFPSVVHEFRRGLYFLGAHRTAKKVLLVIISFLRGQLSQQITLGSLTFDGKIVIHISPLVVELCSSYRHFDSMIVSSFPTA